MGKSSVIRIGAKELTLSNLDKVLYPATGFTKGQMIDYYVRVADALLAHAADRPLTLKRYPEGVNGPFFYEKQCPTYRPHWMPTTDVQRTSKKNDAIHYCVLKDPASIVWVANLASIELHVLLSRKKNVQRPTALAFDFDPGPGMTLLDCAWASFELKAILGSLGLECFPKSSGKKGIHVYVPLNTAVTFEHTKPFAHAMALLLERRFPDRIVSNMSKALRKGKIFVDWSQNDDHKTTVAAYSLRANEQPTVSAPLEWDELARAIKTKDASGLLIRAEDMPARLKKKGDLFAPVETLKQELPDAAVLMISHGPARDKAAPAPRRKPAKAPKALATYNKKRDFSITPEPSGKAPAKKKGSEPMFVIQKHAASHLHYDFRLESRGVLKSWAVPKGLSTDPAVTRLAMQTEDHPMDYAGFEGVIPEGEYGGGAVMVWDTGSFVNVTEKDGKLISFEAGLAKGHVDFWLKGKKLTGAWSLIRTDQGPRHWIIKKKKDAAADAEHDPVQSKPDSVLTGRSIERIAGDRRSKVWHSNR